MAIERPVVRSLSVVAQAGLALLALALIATSCRAPLPDGVQCRSLAGKLLLAPTLDEAVRSDRERKLADARANLAANPTDRDAAIWVGRRLGYLGEYRAAIEVYSRALARHSPDPFLLRHRGHRYLSLRQFALAEADFAAAAELCRTVRDEVEPDGLPVAGRPPHSSLHFNVWYHYGLTLFVQGRAAAAERAWLSCLACCANDEARVAVTHWLWSARMRTGDVAGAEACVAAIASRPALDVVENRSYLQLCLLYAGKLQRQDLFAAAAGGSAGAALRFGLAHYDLVLGREQAARQQFRELAQLPGWAAFGVIAAEAELARLGG